MSRLLLALVVGLAIVPSVPAAAQDGAAVGEISEARALFIAGRSAFNEGRYEAAYDYFEQSLKLSGRKVLLFNMAQCLDRLRRDEEALAAFEEYLAEVPNADNRAEVESRVQILKAALARQAASAPPSDAVPVQVPSPAPVATPPAVPTPEATAATAPPEPTSAPADVTGAGASGGSFPVGPVITMAGGGALGVVGAAFMASALGTKSDIAATQVAEKSAKELIDELDSADSLFTAGQVMLYGGIAVAAGGLVWLLLEDGNDEAAGVAVLPGPTGVSLKGRF